MSDDLFPGFTEAWATTSIGKFYARVGGDGFPVVLLHGFPETHACWHRIAPALAQDFKVIVMDIRGYGLSVAPPGNGRETYSKRTMATDIVEVMRHLGHERFAVIGHDRGARVGYRLALDQPQHVAALVLLDIVPTCVVWNQIRAGTFAAPHWRSLARPYPEPETEIASDPVAYFEGWLSKWSGTGTLSAFDPRVLEIYRATYRDPARIHAMCEDYRAGATSDVEADETDLRTGKKIQCPTLIIWSDYLLRGNRTNVETPPDVWRRTFAPNAEAARVSAGHFIAEEAPEVTLQAAKSFLSQNLALGLGNTGKKC